MPGYPRFRSPNLAMRTGRWKVLINDDGSDMPLYNLHTDHAENTDVKKLYPEISRSMADTLMEWRAALL